MEEVRRKRISRYLLFIIACSIALNAGSAYIVDDQKNMYEDLQFDYEQSQKIITELNQKITDKNIEIQELEDKIPV